MRGARTTGDRHHSHREVKGQEVKVAAAVILGGLFPAPHKCVVPMPMPPPPQAPGTPSSRASEEGGRGAGGWPRCDCHICQPDPTALVCSPGVFGSDEPIWLEAQLPTVPSLTWRSCSCGCWGSRKFTPPPNHRSQVLVSRLLLPGAGAAAGPKRQGIGSSSGGSERTGGAKQTARPL